MNAGIGLRSIRFFCVAGRLVPACVLFVVCMQANAQKNIDKATELDEVVVFAPVVDDLLRTTPHNVSVITAEDIERAPSTTVSELLAREANLNLQSFYGSDKKTTIDIRGMGDTAMSNVVVLVDGVKMNEVDLSGSDLTGLALSQIERIEIIRGGGAVQHGDGAVGGVINIITKRALEGSFSGSVEAAAGAYGTRRLSVSGAGRAGPWSLRLSAGRSDSEGYRRNSYLNSRDGSLELRFTPSARFDAFVRATQHIDEYGMPAGLPAGKLGRSTRRSAEDMESGGTTDDRLYVAGFNADFGFAGVTSVQVSLRRRENPYLSCSNGVCIRGEPAPIISNRESLQIDHTLRIPSFGSSPHSVRIGANAWDADYERYANSPQLVGTERHRGNVSSHGGFFDGVFHLTESLNINIGARIDRFETERVTEMLRRPLIFLPGFGNVPCLTCLPAYQQSSTSSSGNWRNHAREFGVTWQALPELSVFASASQHFRSPNVDELAYASTDLKPQHGVSRETGVRYRSEAGTNLSLTFFRIRIEDEIYLGEPFASPGLSRNRNYDMPTVRVGGELQMRRAFGPRLMFVGNVGYVRAKLEGMDADVPLVPRWTASTRVEWSPLASLQTILAARYAGGSEDGNYLTDSATRPPLPSYTVFDLGVRWTIGDVVLSAKVNNLFDKLYVTKGYSGSYYPMPERHVTVGALWRF